MLQMPVVLYSPPSSLAAVCGCRGSRTAVCQHSAWPSGHSERGSQEKRRGISVLCDARMSRFSFQDGLLPPALGVRWAGSGQLPRACSAQGHAPVQRLIMWPFTSHLAPTGGNSEGHSCSRAPHGVRQAVTGLPHTSTSFSAHCFLAPSFHRY